MLFKNNEMDEFDNEPEDLLLDEENDTEFDDDFPEDEGSRDVEPEDDADADSDESRPSNQTAVILNEDEVEENPSPLIPVNPTGALFLLYEENNHAYTDAMTAYFEEKNYQQAIEKFTEAIADAAQRTEHDLTEAQAGEIVAKSMYWQAEAYAKTQNVSQAVETFNALIQNCKGHYLTLAAHRRAEELSANAS